ncbi:T-cell leukemia/lymphoma protein 1A-like [Suncus etruscus]|uniref:T-cell leukemia/lymphoma protein 1A-like n=1 Tax=Suncus etruscus TaxID=109475 RepID=UPI00210F930F|nr:T-cell leukemia/lymphoma protein 1A-like [Suncus etruscus]
MAERHVHQARVYKHPDHLWIWGKNTYLDENQRTWLPIIIENGSKRQVLVRQEDVEKGEAMRPSELSPHRLPLMWQLYPRNRYRDSDSNFWRIVYHVKIDQREDLMLEQIPDPE